MSGRASTHGPARVELLVTRQSSRRRRTQVAIALRLPFRDPCNERAGHPSCSRMTNTSSRPTRGVDDRNATTTTTLLPSMIDKLRTFAATLDHNKRAALHALLVPGVTHTFEEQEVQAVTRRRRGRRMPCPNGHRSPG